jgi:hypothetical protein
MCVEIAKEGSGDNHNVPEETTEPSMTKTRRDHHAFHCPSSYRAVEELLKTSYPRNDTNGLEDFVSVQGRLRPSLLSVIAEEAEELVAQGGVAGSSSLSEKGL